MNKRGFIQIPILIGIIVVLLALGGTSVFLYKQNKPRQLIVNVSDVLSRQQNQSLSKEESPTPTPTLTPTPTPAPTQTLINQTPVEENFLENLILIYAEGAEDINKFITSISDDIVDLRDRKNKIANRLAIINTIHFTDDGGNGSILNQMFSLYAKQHQNEITAIDNRLKTINNNVTYLESWRAAYNNSLSPLLTTPKKIITIKELTSAMEHERDVSDPAVYQSKNNIYTVFQSHYNSVIWYEDEYSKMSATLSDGLAKVTSSPSVNSSYYQPLPQADNGLTMRQQLLLNPIQCKVNFDPYQTTVTCY